MLRCFMSTQNSGFRSDRFRQAREDLGLSQRQFAALLKEQTGIDIKQPHVGHMERNERMPSIQVLIAAARVLEVSPNYLLGFTDNPALPVDQAEEVVVPVRNKTRREQVQELCNLLSQLPQPDFELAAALIRRVGQMTVARQDAEWLALWQEVLTLGGPDLVERFEKTLGVSAPASIRRGRL